MQKISPLRSSIEAFNKFKATRNNKNEKAQKANEKVQSNPFGITFKGAVVQMDVFTSENKTNETSASSNSLNEKMKNAGKLLASAWVGTINKFSSLKTNAIAFGNKIKENTIAAAKKLHEIGNTNIEFDIFKYSVSRLQNKPVNELKSMLASELQGVY